MSLMATTGFAGCLDWIDDLLGDGRPNLSVSRTIMTENDWNRDNVFRVSVQVQDPVAVRIDATSSGGELVTNQGLASSTQEVSVTLADGTWDIVYFVAGYEWETFRNVRIDTSLPQLAGLMAIGDATNGVYTIGQDVDQTEPASLSLTTVDGRVLSNSLPYTVSGLTTGIHVFSVTLEDRAGNINVYTVQVRAGAAKALPDGQWTFGVVARYSNEVRLWELDEMDLFPTPGAAYTAVSGAHLGSGFGIDPQDPIIEQIVADELDASHDTTGKIAWQLYRWVFDNLEYDEERLDDDDLLSPAQTYENGGGVCRDLAGFYVSLLRAANVPARVVSGYLAGNVNGFHAWVEFYAGTAGPDVWAPVDVSPIDGRWDDATGGLPLGLQTAMQSFGVQKPEYLTLRDLPAEAEVDGWSTALSVGHERPQSSPAPEIKFRKDVSIVGAQQRGVLCFDDATLERSTAPDASGCAGKWVLEDFVLFTERLIDYGIQVVSASPGTRFDAELAYPFEDSVAPDLLDYLVYGDGTSVSGWSTDMSRGKVQAEWRT